MTLTADVVRDHLPPAFPAAGPELMVALDIDGTLVDHEQRMTTAVREAVAELRDSGTQVVLATGRSVSAVLPVLEELGIRHGWAVCSNGAVCLRLDPALPHGYEISDVVTFDPEPTLRLLREELPDGLFAVEDLGKGFKVSSPFPFGELSGEVTVVDFEELCSAPASRVTIRAPHLSADDFHALVDRVGLHGVSYAVGWTAWLDIAPEGVTKASALEMLRERTRTARAATVAVGDGRNDIEMLRWAALGVAMEWADEETRAAADLVTGSVHDDGVVPVLHALLGR
ncbi:HAD family hydrolase [uncultured Georgenia sp.]|uniref:HAD family hydrolase n=1 Tax=uncultured Georgenia sp. TaxID=378209 RepID=UPI002617E0D7|nr:HAD family hydrolase [uncultured Georgenia sp.]HLV03631.1 HAD family hydrolase [Actinomycetaceae bacterium]